MVQNHNFLQNNRLQLLKRIAYKPAYKQNQKTGENEVDSLPDDLAEIVFAWPEGTLGKPKQESEAKFI
jgi:hypothetical protein